MKWIDSFVGRIVWQARSDRLVCIWEDFVKTIGISSVLNQTDAMMKKLQAK